MVSKWVITYLYINGVDWGYNPFTNHLLTSWDILAVVVEPTQGMKNYANVKLDRRPITPR